MKTWTSPLCTTKQKKRKGCRHPRQSFLFAVLLVLLVDLAAIHAAHQGHKALGLLEQAEDFRAQLHLEASLLAGLQLHPGKASQAAVDAFPSGSFTNTGMAWPLAMAPVFFTVPVTLAPSKARFS